VIRIHRGNEIKPGIWEYSIPSLGLSGKSRQPLLDSCRQIERALGLTKSVGAHAGVYRSGHTEPSISCAVLAGADLTVSEPSSGNIKFAKFQKFDSSVFKTKDQEAPAR
jgi:hypothetical protein